nr:surface antigen protein [uncultured bacterium]
MKARIYLVLFVQSHSGNKKDGGGLRGYHKRVLFHGRFWLALLPAALFAQYYAAPAGIRPALRKSGSSILAGGRIISPLGNEYVTGAGAFGLAVSPSGRTVVTSNAGPSRNSLTVLERGKGENWDVRQIIAKSPESAAEFDAADWKGVFMGLAFSGERSLYVSEGNSGRISLFEWKSDRRRTIDLNQQGFEDSYTGDLALDPAREILYVVDQANFRVAVIDTKSRQIKASIRVGRLPFALALSPDRRKLYVTNIGMFQYRAIPGADPKNAKETGLDFPAFGFPSPASVSGAERQTGRGAVQVPGLGDPNVNESNSLCVIDVASPAEPKLETFIRTGVPLGRRVWAAAAPRGW